MLFITGTLWGWVEARPEKQGLMTVVSHTVEGLWLLCIGASEIVIVAGLSSQGDFESCFSGVPIVICDLCIDFMPVKMKWECAKCTVQTGTIKPPLTSSVPVYVLLHQYRSLSSLVLT